MAISTVKCQVRIIGAKNVVTKRQGALFVRCYLTVGKNKRIQLNTREIITSEKLQGDFISWDETFSLECNTTGTENSSLSALQDEKIVFEIRFRNTKGNFLGQFGSSQVLARGEVPWKSVFVAPRMEIVKWVYTTKCGELEGLKPLGLQVGVKVEIEEMAKTVSREEMRRKRREERLEKCGCGRSHGGFCGCVDNELFLVGCVLDVC